MRDGKFEVSDFREFGFVGSIDGGGPKDRASGALGRVIAAEATRIANDLLLAIKEQWLGDYEEQKRQWLAELLKDAPVVYRLKNGMIVSKQPVVGKEITFTGPLAPTHTARLVDIKPIEVKP